MTWKDNLLQASFRGAPFYFEDLTRKGGRRYTAHEMPQRDLPVLEDLGELPRRFVFDAYVLGPDYHLDRDALVSACSRPDSVGGTLVHPTYGLVLALCTKLEVRENTRDAGMASFALEFTRVSNQQLRIESTSPRGAIEEAATAAEDAAEADVAATLQAKGVPETVRDGSRTALQELSAELKSLDVFSGPAAQAADLGRQVEALAQDAASLIKAPADLAFSVRATVAQVAASVRSAASSLAAYEVLLGLEPPRLLGGGSIVRDAHDSNARKVNDLARIVAASGAAQAAVDVEWKSLDAAVERRNGLVQGIDALLPRANAATYSALQQLQATLVAVVPSPDENLPRVREIVLPQNTPALVLAYDLYGDPSRARSIAVRNQVPHPGAMPGGRPLQVLDA